MSATSCGEAVPSITCRTQTTLIVSLPPTVRLLMAVAMTIASLRRNAMPVGKMPVASVPDGGARAPIAQANPHAPGHRAGPAAGCTPRLTTLGAETHRRHNTPVRPFGADPANCSGNLELELGCPDVAAAGEAQWSGERRHSRHLEHHDGGWRGRRAQRAARTSFRNALSRSGRWSRCWLTHDQTGRRPRRVSLARWRPSWSARLSTGSTGRCSMSRCQCLETCLLAPPRGAHRDARMWRPG
jgi:hypothetical protein